MRQDIEDILTDAWRKHVEYARAIEQEPCIKAFMRIQTADDSLIAWAEYGITEAIIRAFIESLD